MDKLKNVLKVIWIDKAILFCLLSIVVLFIQFWTFFCLVSMPYGYSFHTMSIIFLSDILLVLYPFVFVCRKLRWTVWIPVVLMTIWMVSNVWYARTYMSLMPLSSYFLFENVNAMLVASIIGSVKLIDLLLILPTLLLFVFYKMNRTEILKDRLPQKFKWSYVVVSAIVVCLCQLFYSYRCYELRYDNGDNETFLKSCMTCTMQRLEERSFHRMDYYMSNGFVAYMLHYLSDFSPERELTQDELDEIKKYLNEKPFYVDSKCDNIGKNLIFVVVESLNSWVLDYEIDGRKVAPTLSGLFNDTAHFAVRNVVPQVCNGRSSDAHFMYNTGLLPSLDVVTAVDFGDVEYPSLAKALHKEGYYAFEVIGDNVRFGNQEITRRSYGFDVIYDKDDCGCGEVDILDADSLVLEYALGEITSAPMPFYAMVVTLSMHMPYNKMSGSPFWLSECDELSYETRCYLSAVWNFDARLSRFLDGLKKSGIYENSVVVIISDHNGYDKSELGMVCEDGHSGYVIPFVVLNGGVRGRYSGVAGQVDIYPTLMDVMGVLGRYEWAGLGCSLFREPKVVSAVDKNGNVIGEGGNGYVEMQKKAWKISNNIITSRYFD